MAAKIGDTGRVSKIVVTRRNPSGHISALKLIGKRSSYIIKKELNIRKSLGDLRSSMFKIDVRYDKDHNPIQFIFTAEVGAMALACARQGRAAWPIKERATGISWRIITKALNSKNCIKIFLLIKPPKQYKIIKHISMKGIAMKRFAFVFKTLLACFLPLLAAAKISYCQPRPVAQANNNAATEAMPAYNGPKARIAIADFDVKAANASREIGTGLKDMLATALVNSNRFRVVERQVLNAIMQEQELASLRRSAARWNCAWPDKNC